MLNSVSLYIESMQKILLALTFIFVTHAQAMPVYGEDDRLPVADAPENLKSVFSAVAVQISKSFLNYNETLAAYTLNEKLIGTLGTTVTGDDGPGKLCPDQRFGDYLNPGSCTGFYVGNDILVTAGHCVRSAADCERALWIFDFKNKKDSNRGDPFILGKNVYACKQIIETQVVTDYSTNTKIDYAIIRLDRKVENRNPLKLRKEGDLTCSEDLFVVGHPSGLPMMYAPNGHMSCSSKDQGNGWFNVNLDTFSGNSGSPVVNASTKLVEGILVRGADDYSWDYKRSCYVVARQPGAVAREGVTKINALSSKVDPLLY